MPPFRIEWRDEGRADVRRLDRASAMRLFEGILHYAQTGAGNVAPLHGPLAGSFRKPVKGQLEIVTFCGIAYDTVVCREALLPFTLAFVMPAGPG